MLAGMQTNTHSASRQERRPDADATAERWAGLAGRSDGDREAPGRPFVFLHGLTFDRHMWDTALDELSSQHRTIAFDLPGHGATPPLAEHGLDPVVDAIHEAVIAAQLDAPIVVGHSIGASLASIYAMKYPAAAVVNVDAPVRIEPVARLVQSLAPQITGNGFDEVWSMFRSSMQIERVNEQARGLLAAGNHASQQLVLGYWADLLDRNVEDLCAWVDEGLAKARAASLPYLALYGNPIEAEDRAWLRARLPHAETVVWPVGHHFPHLSAPALFATLLTGLAAGLPPRL
jgi:pimeloyl-ACP methyl ester carboxylesterase